MTQRDRIGGLHFQGVRRRQHADQKTRQFPAARGQDGFVKIVEVEIGQAVVALVGAEIFQV